MATQPKHRLKPAADGTEAPADTGGEGTDATGTDGRRKVDEEAPATTTPLAEPVGPGSAGSVTVFGVEDSENEAGAMQDALTEFGEANGIDITYVGRRDFEQQINVQVLGGNPPDIAAFPQPGKVIQFAQDGDAASRSPTTSWRRCRRTGTRATWRTRTSTAPSTACRSSPTSSRSSGTSRASGRRRATTVPETLTDFKALIDEMIANGDTPLCVGIESGSATGWPFTDWVEELILREQGVDYYNQWVAHEVPFNDQPVVDTFNAGRRARRDRIWTQGRRRVRRRRVDRRHRVRRQRRAAGQRRLHDAPPGELLQPPSSPRARSSARAPAR